MALSISQLVNDYGTYSGGTLIGQLGARATVPSNGWGGVRGVPYSNITFIVKVNGTDYASSAWLAEQKNGNPYIHQRSVARVNTRNVSSMTIDSTPFANRTDELYAEVRATTTLGKNDDNILKYINYLLDGSDEASKAIPTFGTFTPTLSSNPNPPSNRVITSPTGKTYDVGKVVGTRGGQSWLGVYQPENDLEGGYPGMTFKPTGYDGSIGGEEALSVSIPPVPTDVEEEVVVPPIEIIKQEPLEMEPISFTDLSDYLDPIFGDINTDFGFGLGGDVSIGNTNQFTSVNSAGDDFMTRASKAYSGTYNDDNEFNEPDIFN